MQVSSCEALPQDQRDAVSSEYETRLGEWKALQNTEQAELDKVRAQCDQGSWSAARGSPGSC